MGADVVDPKALAAMDDDDDDEGGGGGGACDYLIAQGGRVVPGELKRLAERLRVPVLFHEFFVDSLLDGRVKRFERKYVAVGVK